jgi:hypothetical protein
MAAEYPIKESLSVEAFDISANQSKEVPIRKVSKFTITNNPELIGSFNTVYLNFNRGQRSKELPIYVGESVTFEASSVGVFDIDVWIYSPVAVDNIKVIKTNRN